MQAARDPYFTSPGKARPRPSHGVIRRLARMSVQAGIVICFAGLIAASIRLFFHGYPRLVAAIAILGFMAAAALGGESWRERVALALSVPCFVVGGIAGLLVYFALFSFPWFEAAFNDKGSGPLGLLLFVSGFSVAGGLAGGWGLDRTLGLRRRRESPPVPPQERPVGP